MFDTIQEGSVSGISWSEETQLKKALYASLNERQRGPSRATDDDSNGPEGPLLAPAVSEPMAAQSRKRSASTDTDNTSNSDVTNGNGSTVTSVRAQRKFAQGYSMDSPVSTPRKEFPTSPKLMLKPQPPPILPCKRAKTEDFLTFLCLRGTPALPPALEFFNLVQEPPRDLISTKTAQRNATRRLLYKTQGLESRRNSNTSSSSGEKKDGSHPHGLKKQYLTKTQTKQSDLWATRCSDKVFSIPKLSTNPPVHADSLTNIKPHVLTKTLDKNNLNSGRFKLELSDCDEKVLNDEVSGINTKRRSARLKKKAQACVSSQSCRNMNIIAPPRFGSGPIAKPRTGPFGLEILNKMILWRKEFMESNEISQQKTTEELHVEHQYAAKKDVKTIDSRPNLYNNVKKIAEKKYELARDPSQWLGPDEIWIEQKCQVELDENNNTTAMQKEEIPNEKISDCENELRRLEKLRKAVLKGDVYSFNKPKQGSYRINSSAESKPLGCNFIKSIVEHANKECRKAKMELPFPEFSELNESAQNETRSEILFSSVDPLSDFSGITPGPSLSSVEYEYLLDDVSRSSCSSTDSWIKNVTSCPKTDTENNCEIPLSNANKLNDCVFTVETMKLLEKPQIQQLNSFSNDDAHPRYFYPLPRVQTPEELTLYKDDTIGGELFPSKPLHSEYASTRLPWPTGPSQPFKFILSMPEDRSFDYPSYLPLALEDPICMPSRNLPPFNIEALLAPHFGERLTDRRMNDRIHRTIPRLSVGKQRDVEINHKDGDLPDCKETMKMPERSYLFCPLTSTNEKAQARTLASVAVETNEVPLITLSDDEEEILRNEAAESLLELSGNSSWKNVTVDVPEGQMNSQEDVEDENSEKHDKIHSDEFSSIRSYVIPEALNLSCKIPKENSAPNMSIKYVSLATSQSEKLLMSSKISSLKSTLVPQQTVSVSSDNEIGLVLQVGEDFSHQESDKNEKDNLIKNDYNLVLPPTGRPLPTPLQDPRPVIPQRSNPEPLPNLCRNSSTFGQSSNSAFVPFTPKNCSIDKDDSLQPLRNWELPIISRLSPEDSLLFNTSSSSPPPLLQTISNPFLKQNECPLSFNRLNRDKVQYINIIQSSAHLPQAALPKLPSDYGTVSSLPKVPSGYGTVNSSPNLPCDYGTVNYLPKLPSGYGTVNSLPKLPSDYGTVNSLPKLTSDYGTANALPKLPSDYGTLNSLKIKEKTRKNSQKSKPQANSSTKRKTSWKKKKKMALKETASMMIPNRPIRPNNSKLKYYFSSSHPFHINVGSITDNPPDDNKHMCTTDYNNNGGFLISTPLITTKKQSSLNSLNKRKVQLKSTPETSMQNRQFTLISKPSKSTTRVSDTKDSRANLTAICNKYQTLTSIVSQRNPTFTGSMNERRILENSTPTVISYRSGNQWMASTGEGALLAQRVVDTTSNAVKHRSLEVGRAPFVTSTIPYYSTVPIVNMSAIVPNQTTDFQPRLAAATTPILQSTPSSNLVQSCLPIISRPTSLVNSAVWSMSSSWRNESSNQMTANLIVPAPLRFENTVTNNSSFNSNIPTINPCFNADNCHLCYSNSVQALNGQRQCSLVQNPQSCQPYCTIPVTAPRHLVSEAVPRHLLPEAVNSRMDHDYLDRNFVRPSNRPILYPIPGPIMAPGHYQSSL